MPCAGLSCASWSLRKKTHSLACAARTCPPHPRLLFSKVLASSLLHRRLEQEGPQPPWGGGTRAEVGAAARLVGDDVKCRRGRRFPDASSAARWRPAPDLVVLSLCCGQPCPFLGLEPLVFAVSAQLPVAEPRAACSWIMSLALSRVLVFSLRRCATWATCRGRGIEIVHFFMVMRKS